MLYASVSPLRQTEFVSKRSDVIRMSDQHDDVIRFEIRAIRRD